MIEAGANYLVIAPSNLSREAFDFFSTLGVSQGLLIKRRVQISAQTRLEFDNGARFDFCRPLEMERTVRGRRYNRAYLHSGVKVDMTYLFMSLQPGAFNLEWFNLDEHVVPCPNNFCENCYS